MYRYVDRVVYVTVGFDWGGGGVVRLKVEGRQL